MDLFPVSKPSGFSYPVDILFRRCMIGSSLLFFIPAIRGFSCQTPFLGTLSLVTGCASIQFWWFGIPDWRLTLDKLVAYTTTICYISTGFLHVIHDDIHGQYIYPFLYVFCCLTAANAYATSCRKWNQGCSSWVLHHMLFHFLLSFGKWVVIDVSSQNCSLL